MEASALQPQVRASRGASRGLLLRLRSDEQLVALFRAGSEDAFRVIHDRYRQRLLSYTRQMLQGGGEDALQDVFLRAYRSLRADDRPVALRAWLYRVAHNRCVDELRRPAPMAVEMPELPASDLHDPLAEAGRREHLRLLVADLGRLPDQQRSALLMRELEGLSYADIAATLGVTLPAVKSLLVRGRMGLAAAGEAREAACEDIHVDLAGSCERGVRASGRARRHLHDCEPCRAYRDALRTASRELGALGPGLGPVAALAKLLGAGGSGAALGGGALSGGGVVAGGGIAAATATKVAIVVCCVAVTAGGAAKIEHAVQHPGAEPAGGAPATPASVGASANRIADLPAAQPAADPAVSAPQTEPASSIPSEPPTTDDAAPPADGADPSGGVVAPDEPAEPDAPAGADDTPEPPAPDGEPTGAPAEATAEADATTPPAATTAADEATAQAGASTSS